MSAARRALSAEERRLLLAACELRLVMNQRGRWTVVGGPRPARRAREYLMRRELIEWQSIAGVEVLVVTAAGLAELKRGRA